MGERPQAAQRGSQSVPRIVVFDGQSLTCLQIALPVQPQYGRNTLEQPAAPMAPPPTLQDPAAGTVQQLYGFVARYAGQ
jgi:hypothetical protein